MKSLFMARILATLSWRNIFRNKRRTILTFSAITAGVWSCVALSAVARGMSTQLASDAIDLLTGHVQLHAEGYVDDPAIEHIFTENKSRELREIPGVSSLAERVRVPAVIMSERDSIGITLVGIDPKEEKGLSFIAEAPLIGQALIGPDDDGIILGKKCAEILKTEIGKRVVVMSEDTENEIADRGFVVKGLYKAEVESTEKAFVFVGRRTAQKMLGMGERISEISLKSENRELADEIAGRAQSLRPTLEVHTWKELSPLIVSIINMQDQVLSFWFLIVIVTVAFGLVNTMFMAIFERTREIGMVHALGMKPLYIVLQIMIESLFLLVVGAVVGNLLAYLTIWTFSNGIDISQFSKGAEIIGIRGLIKPVAYTRDLINANLLVLIVGLASSFYPAWRASRTSAAEGMHAT